MSRVRLYARTDVVMGVLLLATTFSWRNHWAHLVLGVALVTVVALHLWLHRAWLVIQVRRAARPEVGRVSIRTRLDLVVDLAMGALFVLSAASGLALVLSDSALWTGLHSASSWSMFLGCVVHIVSHLRWIARNALPRPRPTA
jgi:hypothetical protein